MPPHSGEQQKSTNHPAPPNSLFHFLGFQALRERGRERNCSSCDVTVADQHEQHNCVIQRPISECSFCQKASFSVKKEKSIFGMCGISEFRVSLFGPDQVFASIGLVASADFEPCSEESRFFGKVPCIEAAQLHLPATPLRLSPSAPPSDPSTLHRLASRRIRSQRSFVSTSTGISVDRIFIDGKVAVLRFAHPHLDRMPLL